MCVIKAILSVAVFFLGVHSESVYVASFSKYPGYAGNLNVAGTMTVISTDEKQTLFWSLTGLDTACIANAADDVKNGCGIHIHEGISCASHDDVGGHYYNDATLNADPWLPVVYVAESDGSSNESLGVEVITGRSTSDITNRVMVVHELDSGSRIACGIIAKSESVYVASFSKYPGYTGNLNVAGTMTVISTLEKQTLFWSLAGLDTACVANAADDVKNGCGIHIHEGTSCASHDDVGGHYYNKATLNADPWLRVVYVAESDGSSDVKSGVEVITGKSTSDITNRVMVVHELTSGNRIACGVIGTMTGAGADVYVKSFSAYPGYAGNLQVAGTMTIASTSGTDATAKQTLSWSLTGLDTACVANAAANVTNGCGIHIHTGTSCDSADHVGGHYYSPALTVDPWLPVVYIATSSRSSEASGVEVVTGLSKGDITGRVMVVHELASGARIACGIIELATADILEPETSKCNEVWVAYSVIMSFVFLLLK